jgi:hypothetical protein
MPIRMTKSTEFLRHDFTTEERLEMGNNLAQAHNRLAQIEEEEQVMKAQIKDKKAGVEQSVGTLSRNLSTGFEMQNIVCELVWDSPNVGEVSYKRSDNGEIAKTRAMTEQERQLDLPLEEPKTEEAVEASIAKSEEAVEGFFGKTDGEESEEEKDESEGEYDPDSGTVVEMPSVEHGPEDPATLQAAEVAKEEKRGRGRPKKVTTDF